VQSSVSTVHACLDAIERLDGQLRAFITVCAEDALAQAEAADKAAARGDWLGPLHGLPVALKDCIDVAGLRCTVGAGFFADRVASADAAVVRWLRAAGAILIGKANLHELCFGGTTQNEHYGRCRNPWDPRRIPGGSSGGSAVAVAAGMCWAALGTDTGTSVRAPSALCGLTGLRPTTGAVSNRGVYPLSPPYDTVGPLARSAADAARLFAVIAGHEPDERPGEAFTAPDVLATLTAGVAGLRILVPSNFFMAESDAEVQRLVMAAARQLEQMGAVLVEGPLPGAEQAQANLNAILYGDAAALHGERLRAAPEQFGYQVRVRIEPGLTLTAMEYASCRRWLERWRRDVAALFAGGIDLVLTPAAGTTAPLIPSDEEVVAVTKRVSQLGWAWSAAEVPALVLPCGFSGGLPVGLQLAAARWQEPVLFRAAHAYQSATDWHRARPPLAGGTLSPAPPPPGG
jgi:aspartyl-tRNA(Asn)/glutamyl-tRNA(Gln) amidotransferase subunit A